MYPGLTEEICRPILEEKSGLKLGEFKIGYSPERVNPGDHEHTVDKIVKIVSGCDAETLEEVGALYSLVAKSVYHAPNIATAEAALDTRRRAAQAKASAARPKARMPRFTHGLRFG